MTSGQRDQLAALMDWCLTHRDRIHYPPVIHHQIIRQRTVHDLTSAAKLKAAVLAHGGLIVDCSQMCSALLNAVGAPLHFIDGATGSMLDELPHYTDPRAAYIGALAVFGQYPGHHVGMVRHRDTHHGNPVLFSQGQESDPRMISLLTEAAFQPHPYTMLSVAHL